MLHSRHQQSSARVLVPASDEESGCDSDDSLGKQPHPISLEDRRYAARIRKPLRTLENGKLGALSVYNQRAG